MTSPPPRKFGMCGSRGVISSGVERHTGDTETFPSFCFLSRACQCMQVSASASSHSLEAPAGKGSTALPTLPCTMLDVHSTCTRSLFIVITPSNPSLHSVTVCISSERELGCGGRWRGGGALLIVTLSKQFWSQADSAPSYTPVLNGHGILYSGRTFLRCPGVCKVSAPVPHRLKCELLPLTRKALDTAKPSGQNSVLFMERQARGNSTKLSSVTADAVHE